MYQDFFQFRQEPFSIAPDPHFLFMSQQHKEALAHLLYGIQSSGAFVVLSGEVGAGKTTVCRCFLDQIPENVDIAFILNPKLSANELLASICDELAISYPLEPSTKVLVDRLNDFLLENHSKGRNTLVIIEEAQNLSEDVLEQLRLLTNLETSEKKLLQIVLLAQPEFLDTLDQPNMKQLSQRITARFHLSPLNEKETSQYIKHRLNIAGAKQDPFPTSVKKRIYRFSKGVPRLINLLADRSLLGAYAQGRHQVNSGIVNQAIKELRGERRQKNSSTLLGLSSSIAFFILVAAFIFSIFYFESYQLDRETEINEKLSPVTLEKVEQENNLELADLKIKSSYATASEHLLSLWGLSSGKEVFITNNQELCEFARLYGLLCYDDRVNLGLLLKLGRPAILKLTADGFSYNYVVLTGTKGNKLLIQLADGTREISYQQLESMWLGDFITLVKTPSGWDGQIISQNETSPILPWLTETLELLGYQQIKSNTYNSEQVNIIKELQGNAGIHADGKIGLKTIIYLNTLSGQRVPRLLISGEEVTD